MKCLIYCTKGMPYLSANSFEYYVVDKKTYKSYMGNYNGKIVAEFECDKVEEIAHEWLSVNTDVYYTDYINKGTLELYFNEQELLEKSCLTEKEIKKYLGEKEDIVGYALHISNLKVFDEPRELSEVKKYHTLEDIEKVDCRRKKLSLCNNGFSMIEPDKWIGCNKFNLTKAPQNMMKVWYKGELYILISIQSQHTCNILTGKKTIEIRKQILNALKELIK